MSGPKKLKTIINKWGIYLLIIFFLSLLPSLAVFWRGQAALEGISWGLLPTENVDDQENEPDVDLGVYDPEGYFSDSDFLAIEQLYIDWINYDSSALQKNLTTIWGKNRWPLLTVEPWPDQSNQASKENLLTDIGTGVYDPVINDLCTGLNEYNQPLFLSWGHEMDQDLTERYPWSTPNNPDYIQAFRRFVTSCRAVAANDVYYVWSPVGNQGLEKYWPGHEYVDYIGLAVYSFPQWDRDFYGKNRTFNKIFFEKHERIKDFNKPVIIVELGVTGSEAYQKQWLKEAGKAFATYPLLKSVVYFNAQDTEGAWGGNYPIPDWRVKPDILKLTL